MAALDVLPLATAKAHLNIPSTDTSNDVELTAMIGAAVERVQRHVGFILDPLALTGSQLLACKVALAFYWVTDRPENGPPPGYMTGGNDDTPAYFVSLKDRLVEILGGETGGAGTSPIGAFPDAPIAWPDPPRAVGTFQPIIVWR